MSPVISVGIDEAYLLSKYVSRPPEVMTRSSRPGKIADSVDSLHLGSGLDVLRGEVVGVFGGEGVEARGGEGRTGPHPGAGIPLKHGA